MLLLQGTTTSEVSSVCECEVTSFVYLLDCVIASDRFASLRVWFDLAVACLVDGAAASMAWHGMAEQQSQQ